MVEYVARSIYRKMAARKQQAGWVEKETFDGNIMINMNGSVVLGASRGWIYAFRFDSGSCSCPRKDGRDMLACLREKRRWATTTLRRRARVRGPKRTDGRHSSQVIARKDRGYKCVRVQGDDDGGFKHD